MADAEKDIEYGRDWNSVNVLRVGHHGSNTSTTDRFLEQTSPEIAIISVGTNNQYNHPRADVLERLNNHGVQIYRTDLHGTIWLVSDGNNKTINLFQ